MATLVISNHISQGYENVNSYLKAIDLAGGRALLLNSNELNNFSATQIDSFILNNNVSSVLPFLSAGVRNLESLYQSFTRHNVKKLNELSDIKIANNKKDAYLLATRYGINTPHTIISNDYEKSFNAIKKSSDYVIVKQLKGFGGAKVSRFNQCGEFKASFNEFSDELLFQEYIESSDLAVIRVILVDKKVICSALCYPKSGDFRSNYNLSGKVAEHHPSTEFSALSEYIASAFSLGYVGLDIIKERSTGKYLLLDVNPYPGIHWISELYKTNFALSVVKSLG